VKLLHSGKVRDVYLDGADLVLVASDRISIYDVVLPTPIPDKGAVLTRLSLWWFARLADLVPNHVISTDVPPEFAGRAIRCRRLSMLPVECVARGYLAGSGLREYEKHGSVSGVVLQPGLVEGSRLPEPIFTPSTKAPQGEHDEPMTFAEVEQLVGTATAARLRERTLAVYQRGAAMAAARGILVADTKLEFGWDRASGELVLADEALTPDSSRFWPADDWEPGRPQFSFDKQFVRDWSAGLDWDRTAPGPEIPPDVVTATRARYLDAYERLTATSW
jgi:phosphoribosylaminoimidazole-succinocarboxamide synthase